MKNLLLNLIVIVCFMSACQSQPQAEPSNVQTTPLKPQTSNNTSNQPVMEKISIETADGLEMTADKYVNSNPDAKWIILCHQARYSRGEYIETALRLVEMGYSCLALDQRSGDAVNGVKNETNEHAVRKGIGTEYADALPDVEAALNYTKNVLGASHIMMVGSSYSASLAVIMAAKYPDDVDAIASFSPGNYFKIDGMDVSDFAKKVNLPAFITSAKDEADSWKEIFANIPSDAKTSFLPELDGFHGSKALWKKNEGHEAYWAAFSSFLKKHF